MVRGHGGWEQGFRVCRGVRGWGPGTGQAEAGNPKCGHRRLPAGLSLPEEEEMERHGEPATWPWRWGPRDVAAPRMRAQGAPEAGRRRKDPPEASQEHDPGLRAPER